MRDFLVGLTNLFQGVCILYLLIKQYNIETDIEKILENERKTNEYKNTHTITHNTKEKQSADFEE